MVKQEQIPGLMYSANCSKSVGKLPKAKLLKDDQNTNSIICLGNRSPEDSGKGHHDGMYLVPHNGFFTNALHH